MNERKEATVHYIMHPSWRDETIVELRAELSTLRTSHKALLTALDRVNNILSGRTHEDAMGGCQCARMVITDVITTGEEVAKC